jgi:hypothetical protein
MEPSQRGFVSPLGTIMFPLVLFTIIAIPCIWFASEFQSRRWLRLALGVAALLCCFGVAALFGMAERFNSNAWYGTASSRLIDTTVSAIEQGRSKEVVVELKRLREQYKPTYENRARYDTLVDEFVRRVHATGSR